MAALAIAAMMLASCGGQGSAPGDANATWAEGSTQGRWSVVFTGHGTVSGNDDAVTLRPHTADDRDVTHGALVEDTSAPGDLHVTAQITTDEQLREGAPPNPWEVGWLLWRYQDPDHFYAIALKPNGWELSKQDPAYPGKQRFLTSGASPTFAVGTPHTVEVTHVGPTVTVRADGHTLTTFTDTERPYTSGGVALYTEDAAVTFRDVRIEPAAGNTSGTTAGNPRSTQ